MRIVNNENKFNILDFAKFVNISRERSGDNLIYYVIIFNNSFQLIEHSKCNQKVIYNPIKDEMSGDIRISRKEKMILFNKTSYPEILR